MKKIFALVLMLLLVISLCGACLHVEINTSGRSVRGAGPLNSHEYSLESYTKVVADGYFKIICLDAPSGELRIDIQDNLFDDLEVEQRGATLYITAKQNFRYDTNREAVLYISTAELDTLELPGLAEVNCDSVISGETFSLVVDGAGDVELWLDVDELDIKSSGAAEISCEGRADTVTSEQNGVGEVDLSDLFAKTGKVEINGVGSCEINCSDKLDATINGTGSLTYYGNPKVTKSINGIGVIKKND